MPKPVLSHKQFAAILYTYVIGSSFLFIPEAAIAGKDAWLSTIAGSFIGLVVLAAWLRLARRHPGKSPIQIGIKVLGPIIGYPVGLYLVLIFFAVAALVVQDAVILNSLIVLRSTPTTVIRVTFVVTAVYACYKGVESIGRLCELVFLPLTLMVLVLPAMEFPQLSTQALQPLWVINWQGVLVATLNVLVFPFAETVVPMMFIPFISPDREAEKYYYLVLVAAGALLLIRTTLALLVFSAPVLELFTLPFFALYRHVSLGDFFDRVEGLFLGIFLFGMLIKFIITLYALALGIGQIFSVRRLQSLWLPLGALLITMPCSMFPSFRDFSRFSFAVLPLFALPGELLYPFILAAIDALGGQLKPGTINKLDGDLKQP